MQTGQIGEEDDGIDYQRLEDGEVEGEPGSANGSTWITIKSSSFLTADDWWSVWLGLVFALISLLVASHSNWLPHELTPWHTNPFQAWHKQFAWQLLWLIPSLMITL